MPGKTLRVLIVSLLLGACAAPTKIASNKASDYSREPKRVFLLTDVGSEFGLEFFNAFRTRLTGIFKDCGAELMVDKASSLELDETVHTRKMKTFGADTYMGLRRNGGTKSQYGQITHVIYDARLIDVPTNKTFWRASTDFYRGGTAIPIADRGAALAVDVSNRMKEDQIFRSCAVIKP